MAADVVMIMVMGKGQILNINMSAMLSKVVPRLTQSSGGGDFEETIQQADRFAAG